MVNPCGPEDSRFAKLSINYTSVDILKKDPEIQYYPNPAEGYITIEIRTAVKSTILLMIMDLSRRILLIKNLSGRNIYNEYLDLSDFKPGLYFLQIRTDDEIYRKTIILSTDK